MEGPKAIETSYKGYRFRSRTEARWAVFFDALGEPWEYEKEGFELPDGRYLPDFWLPRLGVWFEVKGKAPTEEEIVKAEQLREASGHAVMIGIDSPIDAHVLFLGWHIGESGGGSCSGSLAVFADANERLAFIVSEDAAHRHTFYASADFSAQLPFLPVNENIEHTITVGGSTFILQPKGMDALDRAFRAFRSARFEFGESGAGK
jgi:hypothetical protein